tara:strand:- start:302 stop:757 length:456 start_codon:yes stop_codon:yes gene_type:complete
MKTSQCIIIVALIAVLLWWNSQRNVPAPIVEKYESSNAPLIMQLSFLHDDDEEPEKFFTNVETRQLFERLTNKKSMEQAGNSLQLADGYFKVAYVPEFEGQFQLYKRETLNAEWVRSEASPDIECNQETGWCSRIYTFPGNVEMVILGKPA